MSDSSYVLYIGFPRNQVPEQQFSVTLNGKDRGFDLKVENTNQLMLFDWQKSELIRSVNPPSPVTQEVSYKINRRTDPYALLMAGVVNDSLVLVSIQEPEPPVVKSNPAKPAATDTLTTNLKTISKDSSLVSNTTPDVKETLSASKDTITKVKKEAETVPSTVVQNDNNIPIPVTVRLFSEKTGPEEKQLVYIDGAGSKADTINVIILKEFETIVDSPPVQQEKETVDQPVLEENIQGDSIEKRSSPKDTVDPLKETVKTLKDRLGTTKDTVKTDTLNALKNGVDTSRDTVNNIKEPLYRPKDTSTTRLDSNDLKDTATSSIVLINSDCTRFATDLDVDKLRVTLLKEKEDDDRTFLAKKVFRTKCFTTKQVKGLTELFNTEASKYMFLDTAFPFVSDSGNFKSLISLFSDPYYINRFKALVRM